MTGNKFCRRISVAALSAVLVLTGCSSENNFNVDVTGDCAITSMVLGQLRRTMHSINSEGRDTTYVTSVEGSLYPLHIDQLKREIYNTDSLPRGTHTDRIVFSSIQVDGYLRYRITETGQDTLYSAGDSLDFTQPRLFTVTSADGSATRTYTVRIVAHQSNMQEFTWRKLEEGNTAYTDLEELKAFIANGRLTVIGSTANGNTYCINRTDNGEQPATVTRTELPLLTGCNVTEIRQVGNMLYALNGDKLYSSSDNGTTWTLVPAATMLSRLMGASSNKLYALSADGSTLLCSANGMEWTAETADDGPDKWPADQCQSAYMPLLTNSNLEAVVLAGFTGTQQRLWRKIIDHTGIENYPWSYYPVEDEDKQAIPALESFSLMAYDGHLLAWGQEDNKAVSYVSSDGGHLWQRNYVYAMPQDMNTENGSFSSVADPDGIHIWIVCTHTGEIWKGFLNSRS